MSACCTSMSAYCHHQGNWVHVEQPQRLHNAYEQPLPYPLAVSSSPSASHADLSFEPPVFKRWFGRLNTRLWNTVVWNFRILAHPVMEKRVKHEVFVSSELFSPTLFCIELIGDLSGPVGALTRFTGPWLIKHPQTQVCKLVEARSYKMMYYLWI